MCQLLFKFFYNCRTATAIAANGQNLLKIVPCRERLRTQLFGITIEELIFHHILAKVHVIVELSGPNFSKGEISIKLHTKVHQPTTAGCMKLPNILTGK